VSYPSWSYRFYQWCWSGLDWLYPPICGGCGTIGTRWCINCQRQVTKITEPLCKSCGIPQANTGLCSNCHCKPPTFRSLRSWLVFEGPIRDALHRLKYRRDVGLGEALVKEFAHYTIDLNWSIDIVVPVPLGIKRLKERGYNQAELIAHPLALALGLRYTRDALYRVRETASQVGLGLYERRENVREAFSGRAGYVRGMNILVVDDVATTGSTLNACAHALLNVDANNVYCITIARALPH